MCVNEICVLLVEIRNYGVIVLYQSLSVSVQILLKTMGFVSFQQCLQEVGELFQRAIIETVMKT